MEFTVDYSKTSPPAIEQFNYLPGYDLRGNLTSMIVTAQFGGVVDQPIDLPDDMEYDAHNRMVKYIYGPDVNMNTKFLKYDPLSRVFRKEEWLGETTPMIQAVTHYYYKGSSLVQEFDMLVDGYPPEPRDELEWDYLRGADGQVIRRRNIQREWELEYEIDRFHYNDPLGTIKEQGEPDRGGTVTVRYGHKG